jgi:hypothetical protein
MCREHVGATFNANLMHHFQAEMACPTNWCFLLFSGLDKLAVPITTCSADLPARSDMLSVRTEETRRSSTVVLDPKLLVG